MVPACRTLDTISVFARTVDDAWHVYGLIAAYDDEDSFSRPVAVGDLGAAPSRPRLGIPRAEDLDFFGDSAAAEAWRDALEICRSNLSASFVEVDMRPFFATAKLLYEGPWIAERHAATRAFIATNRDDVHPVTLGIIESAQRFSATDAFDGWYALMARRREVAPIFASLDALCVPTLPRVPTLAEVAADPILHNSRLGLWTNSVNLLDLAALAVPGPFRRDRRPAGITLIAPRGSDRTLAEIGRVFHAAVDPSAKVQTKPRAQSSDLAPGMIEVAVVGAHMSGMALNGELLARGATFRRALKTEPSYKLFALPGAPPARPGLVRVAANGHAIEVEVWAMPVEELGRFLTVVPAPLTIGTLALADGSTPKGFLAEASATSAAEDISALGGWRGVCGAGLRSVILVRSV